MFVFFFSFVLRGFRLFLLCLSLCSHLAFPHGFLGFLCCPFLSLSVFVTGFNVFPFVSLFHYYVHFFFVFLLAFLLLFFCFVLCSFFFSFFSPCSCVTFFHFPSLCVFFHFCFTFSCLCHAFHLFCRFLNTFFRMFSHLFLQFIIFPSLSLFFCPRDVVPATPRGNGRWMLAGDSSRHHMLMQVNMSSVDKRKQVEYDR